MSRLLFKVNSKWGLIHYGEKMNKDVLERTVMHLEKILEELGSQGIDDEKIMSRYVEYRVALELGNEVMLFKS